MSISFPGIGLDLPYVGRSLRLFGMDISYYGILIAIGMVLALSIMILEVKRRGQDPNQFLSAMIVAFLLGTICSRALYVACYWPLYEENPISVLGLRGGGMAIYGAILGGWIGVSLVASICHAKAGKMLDIIAPALLFGQAIGRLGDFFNRGSFGEYTSFLTRMRLPLEAVSAGQVTDLMRENLQMVGETSYILVHPTFAYESLWCLFLMACLMVARRHKLFEGEIFWRYLVGYGLGRAPIEYLRTDKMEVTFSGRVIYVNLFLSLFFVGFGCLVLLIRRSMARKRLTYRRMRQEAGREREEQYLREESRVYLSDIEEEVGPFSAEEGKGKGSVLPEDVRHLLEDMEAEQRRFAQEEKERWKKAVAAKEGETPGEKAPTQPLSQRSPSASNNPFAGLSGASSLGRRRKAYRPFREEEPQEKREEALLSSEMEAGKGSLQEEEERTVPREELAEMLREPGPKGEGKIRQALEPFEELGFGSEFEKNLGEGQADQAQWESSEEKSSEPVSSEEENTEGENSFENSLEGSLEDSLEGSLEDSLEGSFEERFEEKQEEEKEEELSSFTEEELVLSSAEEEFVSGETKREQAPARERLSTEEES